MARTIQIGKRHWLAGMTWRSFEDTPNKEELKEDAHNLGASWVCVRNGRTAIQAGFCATIDEAKQPSKFFSLAAMLADSRQQPWLGIFKIEEDLWWYVAVRDGHAILPDGDVIGGQAEIYAARERHSGFTDWKYIEGDIADLDELIKSIGEKPTPVRSLTGGFLPSFPVAMVVSLVVLACAMGGGYWWWQQKQLAEEQERAAAMAKMRAQLAAGQPVVVAPSPLLTTPQPNEWLRACGAELHQLPLSGDGWALGQVACDTASATVRWHRKDGATVANRPEGVLSPSGEFVDQVIQLRGLSAQGPDSAIDLPAEEIALRAWAQAAMFTLGISSPTVAPPLPGTTPTAAAPPPRPQRNISLDILISPFDLDLSSIPGLRLNSLKTTENGWHIEGSLYGR